MQIFKILYANPDLNPIPEFPLDLWICNVIKIDNLDTHPDPEGS
jgi:hypothetical protein